MVSYYEKAEGEPSRVKYELGVRKASWLGLDSFIL